MMEPLRGRWTDTNGDTWEPEWQLNDAEKAIFELQTALEEANIYLTLAEVKAALLILTLPRRP